MNFKNFGYPPTHGKMKLRVKRFIKLLDVGKLNLCFSSVYVAYIFFYCKTFISKLLKKKDREIAV